MTLRSAVARLQALFRQRKLDRELDDEILAHLAAAEREGIAAGLTPEEARRAARLSFGGIVRVKEEHRDQRSARWLENLWRDFRYGLAALARDPGFALIVIGLLALGIGANTAMFSVVDAVLLEPLPFPEPERMVRVWEAPPDSPPNYTTTLTFLDWKRQDVIFKALAAESPIKAAVGTGEDLVRLSGKAVSAGYFEVFGVQPAIGRTFLEEEDQPGADPVVVLSHSLWQARFGGDAAILSRELTLDGQPYRIIGVLPPGSFDREEAGFWKPLIFTPTQLNRDQHWLPVVGRLQPGVSLERARAMMRLLRDRLDEVMPSWKKDWTFAVDPFSVSLVGDTLRRSLYVTFGAVLIVLLIACANIANLVLAKAATRRKEIALRVALGASRGRLIAQLLAESAVLGFLGVAAGVALAYLLLRAVAPLAASSLPFTADLGLDLRVFSFAAVAALAGLLLTGLFPALQTLSKLPNSLNQGARGSSGSSALLRRKIVIAEVAASVVLICAAVLLFKSLEKLHQVDPGIRINNVITMSANLPTTAYPTPESAARFYEAVIQQIRAVPGVEQAAVSLALPLQGVHFGEGMSVSGLRSFNVGLKLVDSRYFDTLQIPLESGRAIQDENRAGTPLIAVINEELAEYLSSRFEIPEPVGQAVDIDLPGYGTIPESRKQVEIVGVSRNERTRGLDRTPGRVAYVPLAQVPRQDIKLLVRTRMDPWALMSGIRDAVRKVDPHLPLGDEKTMKQVKEQSLLWAKQPTWVVGAFAAVAALLAALGLYGILAYSVAQQRREIGIRMALGADQGAVLSYILRNALSVLIVGLVVGLAGAFMLTRVLQSLLFETSPLDPAALIVACLLMTLIGMLAAWIPARRAVQVDPIEVLREEG